MVSIIDFYVLQKRPSKKGFDIVIGNPPYGAKYDNQTKRYYKNTYVTANSIRGLQKGSLDTYTLFIELGYNLLRKNGSFAYIVPISLTSSDSLTGVHRLLMGNCDTIYISSYAVRPKPVFENACSKHFDTSF
ncbi:BREX-1 system adenine-specific DNA-methyltransferase PglX [Bacteroides fragilis]|nr:BREX-1 system adenine-specific DNA-methyltransferase PglX [Bacteroides fragilis]